MAAKKGAPGYNNLVPETSAYFKDKPKPKKPERERQFAYELKVHLKDKADCDAFAKCIQHPLSRSQKAFWYSTKASFPPSQWKFVEDKPSKPKKVSKQKKDRQRYKDWFYNRHWVDMPSFSNNKIPPYLTFTVRFNTKKAFMDFALKTGQTISVETKSIWYPEREKDYFSSTFWVSTLKDKNPRYPVYIVSKGRAGSRLTSRTLEKMNVPYFIAVEPQDYDAYSVFIDPKKILTLDFSNHGDGPGPARNWCWQHSIELGAKRHWVLDDNISGFYRLHENKRIRVADGAIFRAAEDFVDRYENVPVAGFQYRFFIAPNQEYPPFVKNTRIYSCLLIDNDCKHKWRGRYNEDTILSLDVMKDGDCTIQFNAFLQGKAATQTLKGGNTDEFYSPEGQEERADGTRAKSEMLKAIYPDLVEVVYRYGRWHHHVDYSVFHRNRLKPKIDLTKLAKSNDYGMRLQSPVATKEAPKASITPRKTVKTKADDALFYSTQSFTGWNAGNLLPSLKILETQSSRLHWLTNLTRTGSSIREISRLAQIELQGTLCIAPQMFAQAKAGKYEQWTDVYDDLDPRPLKHFSSLYVMGGILSTGSHLHRHLKRAGVFPNDSGQLSFRSAAIHLINLLLILKAHNEFNIPLHEWAFDPLELSLSLFHKSVAPTTGYYAYHGYPISAYNMHRLDSIQYYFAKPSPPQTEKSNDFAFGFTMLKGSGRDAKLDYMRGIAKSFPKSKVKLFVRDDANGTNTLLPKSEYLSWIARSRYTFVLPAYDSSQFSITRLLEALHLDCLPIIHPDACMKEVEKSFGVKLASLTALPTTERQRLELLNFMKRKFMPFRKSFVQS